MSQSPKYRNGIRTRFVPVPTLGTGTGQFSKLSMGTERRLVDIRNGVRERKREQENFQKQVRERIFQRKWYVMKKFP